MEKSKRKGEGHRKRLREKFIKSGIAGFHDYEIVELLLTLGTPRKDCKQQAKAAIKKFKTLRGVRCKWGLHQNREISKLSKEEIDFITKCLKENKLLLDNDRFIIPFKPKKEHEVTYVSEEQ